MPTERLSMRKIRDVLRLKFENGLSVNAGVILHRRAGAKMHHA